MINTTNIKIAKKYEDKIERIYTEGFGSEKQYICELKDGYIFGLMEAGIYFADTQKELLDIIRTEIEEEEIEEAIEEKVLSLSDIKEGDFVQQKSIKKPLKVVKDKVTNQLGVRTVDALGVVSGQPYIYLKDLKLEYLEKVNY
ncbi:hypothetical protein ACSXDM_15445 (plasmid) [Clostridium perfringens]